MEAIYIDKNTKKVKERYDIGLVKVDLGFKPTNFKGKSLNEYTREAIQDLKSKNKYSTTFDVLGDLTEESGKNNPDLSNGECVSVKVQTNDIPKETHIVHLDPLSAHRRSQGFLGLKLTFAVKRTTF